MVTEAMRPLTLPAPIARALEALSRFSPLTLFSPKPIGIDEARLGAITVGNLSDASTRFAETMQDVSRRLSEVEYPVPADDDFEDSEEIAARAVKASLLFGNLEARASEAAQHLAAFEEAFRATVPLTALLLRLVPSWSEHAELVRTCLTEARAGWPDFERRTAEIGRHLRSLPEEVRRAADEMHRLESELAELAHGEFVASGERAIPFDEVIERHGLTRADLSS